MCEKFYIIRYREDVTGISEARIVAGKFDTLEEACAYYEANGFALQNDNPYYYHLAAQEADEHYYLLGDHQIVYILP